MLLLSSMETSSVTPAPPIATFRFKNVRHVVRDSGETRCQWSLRERKREFELREKEMTFRWPSFGKQKNKEIIK